MTTPQQGAETGVAEVNGTRLYYESLGTGPVLLFLHGFTLDHRMWNRQKAELATAFRVVTYDARGFGRSALPSTETYRHCDDAAALCDHLGLERVIAVGHSIGAHQMLEFALSRPDRVAGWVSICLSGLAGIPFTDDLAKMFAAVRQTAREQGIDAAKTIWGRGDWFAPAREDPLVASDLDAMLADYSGWHWMHDNPAKGLEPPAGERLAELRAPALIVTGGRDLPYNQSVRDRVVARVKSATVVDLAHASHMANMDDADAVNGAIATFARNLDSTRVG